MRNAFFPILAPAASCALTVSVFFCISGCCIVVVLMCNCIVKLLYCFFCTVLVLYLLVVGTAVLFCNCCIRALGRYRIVKPKKKKK
ncbi:hypothetical protein BZA70DRAFT_276615, partial [Myxozyma melibiosi]